MELNNLTIAELEELTKVNRRTIHYYINEKLIPPANGAGQAARYSHEHYYRLLLITWMQEQQIKLSGIKVALSNMSMQQIKREVKQLTDKKDKSYITGVRSKVSDIIKELAFEELLSRPRNISFIKEAPTPYTGDTAQPNPDKSPPPAQWHRYEIISGLEINIRSDVLKKYGNALADLINKLKQTFMR